MTTQILIFFLSLAFLDVFDSFSVPWMHRKRCYLVGSCSFTGLHTKNIVYDEIKEFVCKDKQESKAEAWRMLGLDRLFSFQFDPTNEGMTETFTDAKLPDINPFLEGPTVNRIVFFDSILSDTQSNIISDHILLSLCNSSNIYENFPKYQSKVEQEFDPNDRIGSDFLISLQERFQSNMYVLKVNKSSDQIPIQILHVICNKPLHLATPILPSIFIDVLENASVSILESFIYCDYTPTTAPKTSTLVGSFTNINVRNSSSCEYTLSQELSASCRSTQTIVANVACNASLILNTVQLGSLVNRLNCNIFLNDQGSDIKASGLIVGNSNQCLDAHSTIFHGAENSNSEQNQKSILGGSSHGIFRGAIHIPSTANGASAKQLSRSLLIGAKARVRALPILKVSAEDVTCSHGATISDFDENSIFYMKSRGIGSELAKRILMKGFVSDSTSKINTKYQKIIQRIHAKVDHVSTAQTDLSAINYIGM